MNGFDDSGKLSHLEQEISAHIEASRRHFRGLFGQGRTVDVIKYLPPGRLNAFLATKQLYASDIPGYTWGDAVYVAPLRAPFSTMMYGRAGVVGQIAPQRVYDAAGPQGIALYQQWIRYQWRWYDMLTATVHSNIANRYLRNRFRTFFHLDCVFFRPDQFCPGYVGPQTDLWLALTHWGPTGRVAAGFSGCVRNAEWCVVTCEEFVGDKKNVVFDPLLGPAYRGMRLPRTTIQALSPNLESQIRSAYNQRLANPASPILIVNF